MVLAESVLNLTHPAIPLAHTISISISHFQSNHFLYLTPCLFLEKIFCGIFHGYRWKSEERSWRKKRRRSKEETRLSVRQSRSTVPSRSDRPVLEERPIRSACRYRCSGLPRRRARVLSCWGNQIFFVAFDYLGFLLDLVASAWFSYKEYEKKVELVMEK